MSERIAGALERLSIKFPRISIPPFLALAFLTDLAAMGNPGAAHAQEMMKEFIGGKPHDCIAIVREYPKGTDKPGVYYFPGGPVYYSKKIEPPMFVFVTGHTLPEHGVPFSMHVTKEDLEKTFEHKGMLCQPEPEAAISSPDFPQLPPLPPLPLESPVFPPPKD